MYRTVIELKKDVEENTLQQLKSIIENAFSNREGTVVNISNKPFCFEFAGGEKEHGCLEIGLLNLKREKLFWQYVNTWKWIDEYEPDESCDVIEEFSKIVR